MIITIMVCENILRPKFMLSKSKFGEVLDYIRSHASSDECESICALVESGFENVCNFSMHVKDTPENIKKKVEQNRSYALKKGKTQYELFHKSRYERLKKEYPDVPCHLLQTTPIDGLSKLQEEYFNLKN